MPSTASLLVPPHYPRQLPSPAVAVCRQCPSRPAAAPRRRSPPASRASAAPVAPSLQAISSNSRVRCRSLSRPRRLAEASAALCTPGVHLPQPRPSARPRPRSWTRQRRRRSSATRPTRRRCAAPAMARDTGAARREEGWEQGPRVPGTVCEGIVAHSPPPWHTHDSTVTARVVPPPPASCSARWSTVYHFLN